MANPIAQASFLQYRDGAARPVEGGVPVEEQIVLSVNGIDLVGLRCTPVQLEELAIGFLFNEQLVEGLHEVASARVCGTGRCVDVWLYKDIEFPTLRTITSGCSGGTTFESQVDTHQPVVSQLRIAPGDVLALMNRLHEAASLYRQVQGIHTSALAAGRELLCVAEDVGRHNTLDKLAGLCLRREIETRDRILITSGRVSSEMLSKAARMQVPVVLSRTSPTSLSVELARAWSITLVGYVRGRTFRIYAGEERIEHLESEVKRDA
jgi:FdhD protein